MSRRFVTELDKELTTSRCRPPTRNATKPSVKAVPRATLPQMIEQGQKSFLNDFLSVGNGDAGRDRVAEKRKSLGIVESEDLQFQSRSRLSLAIRPGDLR